MQPCSSPLEHATRERGPLTVERVVWVVGDDNIARLRWVRVSPFEHDGLLEITEGLKPDEWIACRANDPHLNEGKRIEPKRVP